MSAPTLNTPFILHEVRSHRWKQNIADGFKLIATFSLALLAAAIVITAVSAQVAQTFGFLGFLIVFVFIGIAYFVIQFISLFWLFFFYFWASVQTMRQRTLLTLLQTAIETGKPLQDIIRAHASSCSLRYAARLQRFANALDSGLPLEAAVREHWGLFRYDVAAMIRLGGNAPETIRTLENVAKDESDFAAIRTTNIIRVVYLCALVIWILQIATFHFIRIIPEFKYMFAEFDSEFPALTDVVISAADYFVQYWYLLAPFALLFVLLAVFYLLLQTNIAVFRPLGLRRMFRNTDSAKFLLVFAVGVRQKFSIPTILQMYRWTVPSDYLRKKGAVIQKAVESGGDWIDAVCRAGFVSEPEASLLKSAQRTGNTATVLDQLAQSKERTQVRRDDVFSKMAFIPLIFLFAAVIGTFVIAMFLPLIQLITNLSF